MGPQVVQPLQQVPHLPLEQQESAACAAVPAKDRPATSAAKAMNLRMRNHLLVEVGRVRATGRAQLLRDGHTTGGARPAREMGRCEVQKEGGELAKRARNERMAGASNASTGGTTKGVAWAAGATKAKEKKTWFAAAKTCGRPESSSVCEAGTESGLQHLPPNWAHGISPLTMGMAPRQTREAVSTRPVIGHAQSVPGIIVANIANNARIEKGSRSHAFIELKATRSALSRSLATSFRPR